MSVAGYFDYLGSFRIAGTELAFDVKGQTARLKPRPPLLGLQPPEALRSHKPEYDRDAAAYSPSSRHLEALRALNQEARVLIYFGTWCPACGRLVPNVLRVDDGPDLAARAGGAADAVELLDNRGSAERALPGSGAHPDVDGIGNGDDPCAERDLPGSDSVRAGTIPALQLVFDRSSNGGAG